MGVTNSLVRRIWQHRQGAVGCFTSKYNVARLVYFEPFKNVKHAIARAKQLKAGSRKKKIALIDAENPEWLDLAAGWFD